MVGGGGGGVVVGVVAGNVEGLAVVGGLADVDGGDVAEVGARLVAGDDCGEATVVGGVVEGNMTSAVPFPPLGRKTRAAPAPTAATKMTINKIIHNLRLPFIPLPPS